jgi:hypothetical protein
MLIMARIKIKDLPQGMKISEDEMKKIVGGLRRILPVPGPRPNMGGFFSGIPGPFKSGFFWGRPVKDWGRGIL